MGILSAMKTTLEIPTPLYRQAKAKAALEGRKLKDLVEEGLTLVLRSGTALRAKEEPSAYETMKDACGCMDSGVSDLASNPRHMKHFGRE
jgi:hypothetical protein